MGYLPNMCQFRKSFDHIGARVTTNHHFRNLLRIAVAICLQLHLQQCPGWTKKKKDVSNNRFSNLYLLCPLERRGVFCDTLQMLENAA